jgi:arsenate reductase-like glutaredoxin family protein
LFKGKSRLLVAKGKKLVDSKFADLTKAELERLVIGPSGKLRAPTLIRGKTVMVGYHEDGYETFLG